MQGAVGGHTLLVLVSAKRGQMPIIGGQRRSKLYNKKRETATLPLFSSYGKVAVELHTA